MFEHVQTCLRITSIHIILNLNKFRHVSTGSDVFENCMNCNDSYHIENCMNRNNSYHIESEQV